MFRRSKMIYIWMLLSVSFVTDLQAQENKFHAGVTGGVSMTQIDGDGLYGYDLLYPTFGLKVDYWLTRKWDLSMELGYARRGSNGSLFNSGGDQRKIWLDYIEIPIYVTFNDWEQEDYYRVGVQAGLFFGQRFQERIAFDQLYSADQFRKRDIGWLAGLTWRNSSRWSWQINYQQSFLNALINNQKDLPYLKSYGFTFRSVFYF